MATLLPISRFLVDCAVSSMPVNVIIKTIRDNYKPDVIERWTLTNIHKITLKIFKDYDEMYDSLDNTNNTQTAAQIRATVISDLYAKYSYLDKLEDNNII